MTARIFDRLIAHYGKDAVFLDTDDIPASIDFRQHVNKTLLKTSILLAIVGPRWLGAGASGNNFIGDESHRGGDRTTAARADYPGADRHCTYAGPRAAPW